ncbi:unknown [Feldmannia species virus]|uniref:Uncharacterized protein n=1 Tax=Feldmannia species virus TaxID=39420 RepID=B5LWA1_9PHYC|nr:hypothetical protein FeldSpV_gp012 [Feldmannia species virus]ACH46764.1 unknown [Feldmannia species virus]
MTQLTPVVRYPMSSTDTLGTNAESLSFNASVENVSVVADETFGTAAYFSGDGTSRIDMSDIPTEVLAGSAPRSLSFWVNFDEISDNQNVYSQGNAETGEGLFAQVKIGYRGTNVRVEYGSHSNRFFETSLAPNTWYSFVMTYDGVTSKTYWGGDLVLTQTVTLNTEAGFVNLGQTYSNGIDFAGKMVDFRIYDVDMSSEDVSSVFADGPSPLLDVAAVMLPYVAQLSWRDVAGVSAYDVMYEENGGESVVAAESVDSTSLAVYDLKEGSTYNFKFYAGGVLVGSVDGQTTPLLDSDNLKDMLTLVSNDLTVFNTDTVSEMQRLMDLSLETNEEVVVRFTFKNKTLPLNARFVRDGETFSMSTLGVEGSILTPFIPDGSPGQSLSLELSDLSTTTLTFDEINGTVTVDGVTYSTGDKFVLDDRSCMLGSLS